MRRLHSVFVSSACFLITTYKKLVSPLLPNVCKYYPSCSSYALTAYQRHGFIGGSRLTIWRLLRCNPWSHGGVDDVPA